MTQLQVINRTQKLIVNSAEQSYTIVKAGPQGPPGVGGTTGGFLHTQTETSNSWVINHFLGFRPSIDAYDQSGNYIEGHVIHHSINQAEIQLLVPRTGVARLS